MLSTPLTMSHSGLEIYSAASPFTCPTAFSEAAARAPAEAGGRGCRVLPGSTAPSSFVNHGTSVLHENPHSVNKCLWSHGTKLDVTLFPGR